MRGRQSPGNAVRVLALLAVVIAVGGTALAYSGFRSITLQEGRRQAAIRLLAVVRNLDETFSRHLRTVEAIAGDEKIRQAVAGNRKDLAAIRDHLLFYRRSFGFFSCTVLDGEGRLVTSTDPAGALWHSGGNDPEPAWFARARGGKAGIHVTVRGGARRRSIVYSRPVYGKADMPAGVAYVETGAHDITRLMRDLGGMLFISDEAGLILFSNREQFLDRTLWSGHGAAGERTWSGLVRVSPGEARDRAGRTWEIREQKLPCCPGWAVTFLYDIKGLTASMASPATGRFWQGAAAICLAAVLAAAALWQKAGRAPRPSSEPGPPPQGHLQAGDDGAPSAWLSPADMSRAVRAPVDSYIDLADRLLARPDGDPAAGQGRRLRLARSRTVRLRGLLDDIIDIDRTERERVAVDSGSLNAANLLREVSCSFDVVAAERGVSLVPRRGGEIYMRADRERLKQALSGLVRAAITLAPTGGSVALSASMEKGKVSFAVRETGKREAAEVRAITLRPFGPVYDAGCGEEEGVGLALYVSDGIARILGGRLDVASHPDTGTELILTLPADGDSDG